MQPSEETNEDGRATQQAQIICSLTLDHATGRNTIRAAASASSHRCPERLFPGGKWPLSGIELAAENAARLLAAARAAGDLVVHVRHEFPSADAPFFTPGSEGSKIHSKVLSHEGEPVVLKHRVNAFRETDLKKILDRHGVEEVVICGAMSHMCVDAGTRAASDLGYKCVVVHDACATRDQEFEGTVVPAVEVHAAFMAALQFGYAQLVSTEEYLATTPFK